MTLGADNIGGLVVGKGVGKKNALSLHDLHFAGGNDEIPVLVVLDPFGGEIDGNIPG